MRGHEPLQLLTGFGRLARVGVMGLVVGLERFEIIGQVGLPPVEPEMAAIRDQLSFAEGLVGISPVSLICSLVVTSARSAFFLSVMP